MERPFTLFTDAQVDVLIAYYGSSDVFVRELTNSSPPLAAPVEIVDGLISRVIASQFKGWFPGSNMKIQEQHTSYPIWLQEFFRTTFEVGDDMRIASIQRMVEAYQFDYAAMVMNVEIGKGIGKLSFRLPTINFHILPASITPNISGGCIEENISNLVIGNNATSSNSIGATIPEKPNNVIVIPVMFERVGTIGDFGWMIQQPEYQDSLFIFNDNEEANLAYRLRWVENDKYSMTLGIANEAGGGNAVIRPYRCVLPKDHPKSAGLPTGKSGRGYQSLEEAQVGAAWAMAHITGLVKSGKYQRVFFSVGKDGLLGQGIFNISPEVRQFFTNFLVNLGEQ